MANTLNKDINVDKSARIKALEKMKTLEKETPLHSKRINPTTIVCCKNESRIEEYRKSIKIKF